MAGQCRSRHAIEGRKLGETLPPSPPPLDNASVEKKTSSLEETQLLKVALETTSIKQEDNDFVDLRHFNRCQSFGVV